MQFRKYFSVVPSMDRTAIGMVHLVIGNSSAKENCVKKKLCQSKSNGVSMNQCPGKLVCFARPLLCKIRSASSISVCVAPRAELRCSTVYAEVECCRTAVSFTY